MRSEIESLVEGDSFKIKSVSEVDGSVDEDYYNGVHEVDKIGESVEENMHILDKLALEKDASMWMMTEMGEKEFVIFPGPNEVSIFTRDRDFAIVEDIEV